MKQIVAQSGSRYHWADLKSLTTKEAEKNHDLFQLVCGHDASEILGIAFRQLLGRRKGFHTWASEVEAGLRLSFDSKTFAETNVYGFLRGWETKSGGYAIF